MTARPLRSARSPGRYGSRCARRCPHLHGTHRTTTSAAARTGAAATTSPLTGRPRCEKQDQRLVKGGLKEQGRPGARVTGWGAGGRRPKGRGAGEEGCSRFSTRCKQRSATLQGPREERPTAPDGRAERDRFARLRPAVWRESRTLPPRRRRRQRSHDNNPVTEEQGVHPVKNKHRVQKALQGHEILLPPRPAL